MFTLLNDDYSCFKSLTKVFIFELKHFFLSLLTFFNSKVGNIIIENGFSFIINYLDKLQCKLISKNYFS